jgi:hypothetical protein
LKPRRFSATMVAMDPGADKNWISVLRGKAVSRADKRSSWPVLVIMTALIAGTASLTAVSYEHISTFREERAAAVRDRDLQAQAALIDRANKALELAAGELDRAKQALAQVNGERAKAQRQLAAAKQRAPEPRPARAKTTTPDAAGTKGAGYRASYRASYLGLKDVPIDSCVPGTVHASDLKGDRPQDARTTCSRSAIVRSAQNAVIFWTAWESEHSYSCACIEKTRPPNEGQHAPEPRLVF